MDRNRARDIARDTLRIISNETYEKDIMASVMERRYYPPG
jgi:hypothetical protein